mgnify:CR=1 FL=1
MLADSKPEVEIPGIVDGHLVMNGELARYASDMQQLPLPFPDTEKGGGHYSAQNFAAYHPVAGI